MPVTLGDTFESRLPPSIRTPNSCSATPEKSEGRGRDSRRVARTSIVHPFHPGRRRQRFLRTKAPALPAQRFPSDSSSPLKNAAAGAYRPGVPRLFTPVPPNPRLQRTRAAVPLQPVPGKKASSGGSVRSPLSRKPLGRPMAIGTLT